MILKKGEIYPETIGHKEEIIFDIDDSGATIRVFYSKPTAKEKKNFGSGSTFQVRFVKMNSVLMMLFRFGILPWMDAPYTPHLSANLTVIPVPEDGQGLSCTIMLFNSVNGKLEELRFVSFPEETTKELLKTISDMKKESFDRLKYFMELNDIYHRFETEDLLKFS